MSDSRRHPLLQLKNWLFFGLPLLASLVVGAIAIQSKSNTPAAIVFPTVVPLPNPNGFEGYLAAAKAIAPAKPAVDAIDDRQNLLATDPKLAAQNYSVVRKNAWIQANAAGFALFQQGLATPSRHPNTRGSLLGGFKFYGSLRTLARDATIRTHALALQNRPAAAVNSSLDVIQMGSDIARGAPLMGKLVSSAIITMGRASLTDNTFLPEKLDAKAARGAARRLEQILEGRSTFQAAMQEERWVALSNFLQVSGEPKWRSDALGRNATWRQRVQARILTKQTIAAQIGRAYDIRLTDFGKQWSIPGTQQPVVNPIVELFCSSSAGRAQEFAELVPLQILMLRLSLRAYRLENGAFPASLKPLAPKYVAKIPTDVYADNAPFHYIVKGGDYELWSVGPDGKNDGGKPIPWRNGASGAHKIGQFPPLFSLSSPDGDYVARKNN